MEVTLKTGLMYGEEPQTVVTLKQLTTGDMLDAELSAERLVSDKNGNPILVSSQVLFGYELLRRQIASIGKIQGPLSMNQLRSLTPEDLSIIDAAIEAVNVAKANEVLNRGRMEATGEGV